MYIKLLLHTLIFTLLVALSISSFATEHDLDYSRLINEQKEFIDAIKSNDISKIKSILSLPGFRIPDKDENGDSPMIIAAREGNEKTVQFLLNLDEFSNIYINFQNLNFETALIVAVKRNDTNIIKQFLKFYIISGVDITLTDRDKKDALYYAEQNKNQEVVALIKKAITQQKLAEKLIESIANKDIEKAKELIKQGANVNFAPVDEIASFERLSNSLEVAAWSGQTEIVELIIKNGANIKVFGPSALCAAAETGNIDIAKILINAGADINQFTGDYYTTPLIASIKKGHLEMTKFLLANDADPNFGTHKWGYPLTSAFDLVPPADIEMIKLLIESGANVNNAGGLILIEAVRKQNYRAVKLLLENKADPNIQDRENKQGLTALMFALMPTNKEITKLLLEYKADLNLQNNDGNTALMLAIQDKNNEMAKLLLEYKADPNIQNKYGETTLMTAITKKDIEMVKLLLINQADPNLQDFFGGYTALMIAIENKNNDIAKLLLEYKADPNIQSNYGKTALSIALKTNPDMIKPLIDSGANKYQ